MSAAVSGSPFWNLIPGRRWTSMIGLSGVPCTDHDSASQFTVLPDGSTRVSCSNTWLTPYVSTPAEYRTGSSVVGSAAKAATKSPVSGASSAQAGPAAMAGAQANAIITQRTNMGVPFLPLSSERLLGKRSRWYH